jgi:hypothetical protein
MSARTPFDTLLHQIKVARRSAELVSAQDAARLQKIANDLERELGRLRERHSPPSASNRDEASGAEDLSHPRPLKSDLD